MADEYIQSEDQELFHFSTQVRHGCWQNRGIAMACSLCNADLVMEQGTAEMNYCPNCGAKMDLEGEP